MSKDELIQWKSYLDIFGALNNAFGPFSRIYSMTTENILEFINSVDCQGKNVLTVTGSGDQAMNVILNGAKNITCFDINPITFCHLELKKEAIKALSLEEFIRFFNLDKRANDYSFLDKNLFEKVAKNLDSITLDVFNYLYSSFDDTNDLYKNIYYRFDYDYEHLKNMSNYLTKDNYNKLSNILNNGEYNINYIESDFMDLHNLLNGKKYDLILLSNISDYIDWMYINRPLDNYYNDIIKLTDNLNPNGIMQVGYIYTDPDRHWVKTYFGDRDLRQNVFTADKFNTQLVTAYDNPFSLYNDQIITYQKRI